MPAVSASAPGKVILFGEHAVVYGQPAIAATVSGVAAKAIVSPDIAAPAGRISFDAADVGVSATIDSLPQDHPLAAAVYATLSALSTMNPPAFNLRVTSTIPVAAGLGSGAAVSVAIVRAVSAFLGQPLADEQVSAIAFEVEKLHHGTPSGIDNTVISFAKPIFFIKDKPIETLKVGRPLTFVIADTGVASPTKIAVSDVRSAWQADPALYDGLFAKVGAVSAEARTAIEAGEARKIGELMDQNHSLLQEIGVSSPELDRLVEAAIAAGALGAKLSGGGRGGNMIALVSQENQTTVEQALLEAGATGVIKTMVR
jgi:mevalonate kinase